MIIKYPTAMYKNVIPHNPGDGGNVTFTISDGPPPRTDLSFIKIPTGIAIQQKDPTIPTIATRADVGALIYSINSGNGSVGGSTTKQFELGQILEFDIVSPITVRPMLVSNNTEIQHNNNVIDLGSFGISADQQQFIAAEAAIVVAKLNEQLNQIKQARSNADIEINTIQKSINSIGKTIDALTVMNTNSPTSGLTDIIDGLVHQKAALKASMTIAVAAANQLALDATDVLDSIRAISSVVR